MYFCIYILACHFRSATLLSFYNKAGPRCTVKPGWIDLRAMVHALARWFSQTFRADLFGT